MALTVLSYGAGQDSTALLCLLIHDPEFRAKYAPERTRLGTRAHLLVVFSDTGNEHPATYAQVTRAKGMCAEHGIPFFHLEPGDQYHSDLWSSLTGFYRAKNACGSKAFPKTCTDNLKIQPIYRWLNEWCADRTGKPADRKGGLYSWAARHGRIRVLIGIAAGEEKRAGGEGKNKGPLWMQRNIKREYPLIPLGLDRAGCQRLIAEHGYHVPPPSNCMLCPFVNERELLLLARAYPDAFAEWVEIEANKLRANAHKGEKNLGVFGRRSLPEVLEAAEKKFGHMTTAELEEYRFSHGHCVKSSY